MQQTLDDADLLAANLDAASIKQQVNSDAMKEADNAVTIFKIKLSPRIADGGGTRSSCSGTCGASHLR